MRSKLILSVLVGYFSVASGFASPSSAVHSLPLSEIKAKPIPAGYHYPTPPSTITQWIMSSNTAAVRGHAWDIWAGMTADSGEYYEGQQLPIWETWYGSDDIFSVQQPETSDVFLLHRKTLRAFVQPHQFSHLKSGATLLQMFGAFPTRIASFNKFSPEAAEFILTPHISSDGKIYHYNSGDSLANLNKALPATTKLEDRVISDFPLKAIELKPVFSFISATGLTALPLWQGATASTLPETPTANTWTSCVLIDPNGQTKQLRPATESEIASANKNPDLACKDYYYGSLSMLYSFKFTSEEAAAFNKAQGGNKANANAIAVLVALHAITHETPLWTWQTFFWQPNGIDTGYPGSKKGQPKNLKTPWNNYAMCASYDQTTTPGGKTMAVCFNPYLEAGLSSGTTSNCMSCHGVARVAANPDDVTFPLEYKAPIQFFSDPLYFDSTKMRTGFSWAVADARTTPSNQ